MDLLKFLIFFAVFWPMIAAVPCVIVGRNRERFRDRLVWLALALEMAAAVVLFGAAASGSVTDCVLPGVCGSGLFFRLDGFRGLWALISAFLWLMSSLLCVEYMHHEHDRNRFYLFLLLTQGAAMGVFLSADLLTTFIFFEIMSFTSYVWVAQNETKEALSAAATYLAIAVIGGMVLLMGLFLLQDTLGTLRMDALAEAAKAVPSVRENILFIAGLMVLLGFGAKAAMFPLHVWMPRAHTVAPAPASALLSGILTKAGLFGILSISGSIFFHEEVWGNLVLILGLITMVLGAVLAVFAVNLKRTLACSSMSQMGFVLVGIGMASLLGHEGALAVRGVTLHMMNHSLFKLILFLSAGVVYMNLEELELNDVRGFGRKKPLLQAVFLAGALGIGGVPGFSGYVSKTLLHESIVEFIHEAGEAAGFYRAAEWIFLISGGLTVSYMIKLYVALFVNRHPEKQEEFDSRSTSYANGVSRIALVTSAVLIPILGLFPGLFMDGIADIAQGFFAAEHLHHAVHYFAWANLKGGLISIAIGVLVYTLFIRNVIECKEENGCRRYVDRWPAVLDLERNVYRPLILRVIPGILGFVCMLMDRVVDSLWKPILVVYGLWGCVMDAVVDRMWPILIRGSIFILRFFERLPDFCFMLLREFVFNPIHLLTQAEEAEKIRKHRERAYRMAFSKWSTMTLSFGFLTSCAGILIMLAWVFNTLIR